MIQIKSFKAYGRGIVAATDIPKGTVVEQSPVIVLPAKDRLALYESELLLYIFDWSNKIRANCDIAVVLGLGSIFNHSDEPNVGYKCNFKNKTMDFRTLRDIEAGEQLFTDYNYVPGLDDDILKKKRY